MTWLKITDDWQVRLIEEKPEYYSKDGLSLKQVAERVRSWMGFGEDPRMEAWLEAAEIELDLQARTEDHIEVSDLMGWNTTYGEARAIEIRSRQFETGERALSRGDYSQALDALRPLAESGPAQAQFHMGIMSAKGLGVPKDYVQAYAWFEAAAQRGHERARKYLTLVLPRLSSDQVTEANNRAAELQVKDGSST